jgi:hypothetical protein
MHAVVSCSCCASCVCAELRVDVVDPHSCTLLLYLLTHPNPDPPIKGHEYLAGEDLPAAMTAYRNALRMDGRHYNAL